MDEYQSPVWGRYETLSLSSAFKDTSVEVVVIGAGVAGLTAAHMLADAGICPLVIEAEGIGSAMTGRSTAHISAAVDGGWRKMVPRLGQAQASELAQAYRMGIESIYDLAEILPHACDFDWVEGELVGTPNDLLTLDAEREAAAAAGVEVSHAVQDSSAKGMSSIRFARQGRLHPLKYVDGIARLLVKQGVNLVRGSLKGFQATPRGVVLQMKDEQRVVATRAVVLAHHLTLEVAYPGVTVSRRRSYVIAADYPDPTVADTITWDLAHPYHYTRLAYNSGERLLIVGGGDHPTERHTDPHKHFETVEKWMRKRFPTVGQVRYRWHGDLKQTSDSLALLGQLPGWENVYVLDGDTGLGFNHAMLGAHIVRDHLLGRANRLKGIFSPARIPIK